LQSELRRPYSGVKRKKLMEKKNLKAGFFKADYETSADESLK
jgi:hypothetical protein